MSQPSRSGGSRPLVEVPADELAVIVQALSKYIGPLAKVLVRKELARQATFRDLVKVLAETIDQPEQRELFLRALKRALPPRN